jgi:hypothetical protein
LIRTLEGLNSAAHPWVIAVKAALLAPWAAPPARPTGPAMLSTRGLTPSRGHPARQRAHQLMRRGHVAGEHGGVQIRGRIAGATGEVGGGTATESTVT